jgi:hypothetical protein
VRPLGVVVDPPRLDPFARIGQREEPAGVETLSSDAGIEGFDERIVGRSAWPREVELDTVQIGPLVEQAPGELWTVVDPDGLRLASFDDKTVEDLDDMEGPEIGSRHRCEALSRAAIHDCQETERTLWPGLQHAIFPPSAFGAAGISVDPQY